jgi:hypothetical protein
MDSYAIAAPTSSNVPNAAEQLVVLSFAAEFCDQQTDPSATLRVRLEELEQASLTVACRAARNRKALYQAKHAGALLTTRQRDPALAGLNLAIDEHYKLLKQRLTGKLYLDDKRIVAFPISDLTANPLRPHYDARSSSEDGACLFYLDGEPIGQVPYSLLLCYHSADTTRLDIRHQVRVNVDGSLPDDLPKAVQNGLTCWMACPPLLMNGDHNLEEFAIRDYDLRHVFGFPDNFQRFGYPSKSAHESALYELYDTFPRWNDWSAAIRRRLAESPVLETGYHAALGISEDGIFVVHRVATIPELGEELKQLGARDAVLLDSGGSCAIWANWVNGNHGGVLANAWNFRQPRGAVLFLVLKGSRGIPPDSSG